MSCHNFPPIIWTVFGFLQSNPTSFPLWSVCFSVQSIVISLPMKQSLDLFEVRSAAIRSVGPSPRAKGQGQMRQDRQLAIPLQCRSARRLAHQPLLKYPPFCLLLSLLLKFSQTCSLGLCLCNCSRKHCFFFVLKHSAFFWSVARMKNCF